LNDVLGEHLAERELHLVSIDVEGMEHEVLKGHRSEALPPMGDGSRGRAAGSAPNTRITEWEPRAAASQAMPKSILMA
jgi:hypothetical protein